MSAIAELTESHRLAQLRIGQRTVRQMVTVFDLLDRATLDPRPWLRIAVPLLEQHHAESAELAASYLRVVADEQGVAAIEPLLPQFDVRRAATSLHVTGPIAVKQRIAAGVRFDEAFALSRAASARAAMRHALTGGRDAVRDTVHADPAALGWARATSGKPCAFCAMLASRGPVYKTDDTAGFRAHDGCSCTAVPTYSTDQEWPNGAHDFAALWQESTRGHSGKDAINAFRRALDS